LPISRIHLRGIWIDLGLSAAAATTKRFHFVFSTMMPLITLSGAMSSD
jgi:hypothetical protein